MAISLERTRQIEHDTTGEFRYNPRTMSEIALVWIQVIVFLFAIAFLSQWLTKLTKDPILAAVLLAVFFWIWIDVGGLSGMEKVGIRKFLSTILLNILSFGVLSFIAFCFTANHRNDK